MSIAANVAGCIFVIAAGLAPFTKPDQAAHEQKVSQELDKLQAAHLRDGSLLKWVLFLGADMARTGRFEEGLLHSNYQVIVAGRAVARCTGVLGVVVCRSSLKS